ncbi:DUF1656 domain-containing protein [Celerinatantimonas sp. YJH-8]|uniref:DUF1656 domain-containing protein n=1 Tax=Celerinatantimonas sp. YJH-8 TaxID=3228714 RepID=UPI0038C22ECD
MREIAFHSFYFPTVTLVFVLGYLLTFALDRILMTLDLHRHIWNPTLFRIASYLAICCGIALFIYA